MVEIGGKPILWHIMKNLSHHGVDDFVILVGYKGQMIKQYFLNFSGLNSDFSISLSKPDEVTYHPNAGVSAQDSWRVTVLDTGLETLTAGRLARAKPHLSEGPFLLTYGDGLADVDVASLMDFHRRSGTVATITVANPGNRFGVVDVDENGLVTAFREKPKGLDSVNIGYMIFEHEIFNYLVDDEPLETGPLPSLARDAELSAFRHGGFFHAMDTVRDHALLSEIWESGSAPWANWKDR
jgi:glucose-1-phosphate cytidylyltransferase